MNDETLKQRESNLVEAAVSYAAKQHTIEELRDHFSNLFQQHKQDVQDWLIPQFEGGIRRF